MGIGTPELIVLWLVAIVVPLTVTYYLIRAAVRNGVLEALRRRDANQVRGERSPNSLS
jgi:hypothetical protein